MGTAPIEMSPFTLAAGAADECGDQLARVAEADGRVQAKTDAAVSVGGTLRAVPRDRGRGDRRLLLRGDHFVADALRVDRVEIHPQRRIQRVISRVIVLDAGDAQVRGIIARVNHEARDRRLSDLCDERARERRQFLGDQVGIAAAPDIEHPFGVEVEARFEAIVGAQNLERQPRRHDLGDGRRGEGCVGVLGDELVALGVHDEHDPRGRERRDRLIEAGQRRGGQEQQSKSEQTRPHGESGAGTSARKASGSLAPLGARSARIERFMRHFTRFLASPPQNGRRAPSRCRARGSSSPA